MLPLCLPTLKSASFPCAAPQAGLPKLALRRLATSIGAVVEAGAALGYSRARTARGAMMMMMMMMMINVYLAYVGH